jgi:hypothetical protein
VSFGPTPLLIVLVVVCLLLVVARLATRARRSAETDPNRPGDGPADDGAP